MKILITGATGLLGSRFYYVFGKHHSVIGTHFSKSKRELHYLSLLDKNSIDLLVSEAKPDVIIHTAGIADPDQCEKNREEAHKVNVKGTEYIVDACKKNKALLVFISSSHVFSEGKLSGEEKTEPINYYGQTKLESENYIRKNLKDYIILRSTKLYGLSENGESSNFIKDVINKLKNNHRVSMDNALKYYPVITDDIVKLTRILIDSGRRGIYNISSSEPYTKFEWAKLIAETFNLDKSKLEPTEEKTIAKRPQDLSFLLQGLDFKPTPLRAGLTIVKKQTGCMFRMIYTEKPDVLVLNQSASSFRIKIGEILAKKHPQNNADMVVAIPESGLFEATGYAAYLKIPFHFGIIRDYFTDKTLFSPNVDERTKALIKKLIIVEDVVKGKSIVLIDEAIISGLTLEAVVGQLKKAGVKEIHVRIPSPTMVSNCKYNILAPDARLIARDFIDKEGTNKEDIENKLAKHFKVDSLKYLSIEEFLSELIAKEDACIDCFKHNYNKKR